MQVADEFKFVVVTGLRIRNTPRNARDTVLHEAAGQGPAKHRRVSAA